MEQRKISRAVISRLPRYYRYLGDLLEAGVERISSSDLSKKMHVTASQIRQDLNNFGGFGQQGYGYNVKYLYTEIARILGIPVRMVDELEDFLKNNDIEIAALTLPKSKAIEVADILVDNGVKGIWNFAHTDLSLPKDVVVENVHLSDTLMKLSYNLCQQDKE